MPDQGIEKGKLPIDNGSGSEARRSGGGDAPDPPTASWQAGTPPAPGEPRRGWLARWDFRRKIREVLHLDDEPWKIAGGLAAGVFIAFSPYYGVHTLMALAAAFCFRLNVAATVLGAWLVIPPAIPFVMAFCLQVGWALVGRPPPRVGPRGPSAVALWARLARHLWPLVVGSTLVGLAAALVTYVASYRLILGIRARRRAGAQVGETRASDAEFHLDKGQPPK